MSIRLHLLVSFALPFLLLPALVFGAPVIDNPGPAAQGQHTMELEELWRIGGEDDEENLLGVISQVLADDQHNVYLLDMQLTEVMVFDIDGQYVHSLGARGEGPGEIRRATDLIFMPDGTVGLVQGFPGKVVKVNREDGLPAGEYHPGGDDPSAGGFFALQGAASRGGRLAFSGARISRGENSRTAVNFVASFAESGIQENLYHDMTSVREFRGQEFSEKKEFFPHQGGWALGPDGRVFVSPERNDYEVTVYTPAGVLERTIKRPYESWKRTPEEKKSAEDSLMPWRRRNRNRMNLVVEPTDQDILRLRVADDGRLWVLTSRGLRKQAEGIHSTWDVFDTSGKYQQTVAIACEGMGIRDRIFFAGEDKIVLVKQYADAVQSFRGQSGNGEADETEELDAQPLEVICYRILP